MRGRRRRERSRTALEIIRDKTAFHYDRLNLTEATDNLAAGENSLYLAQHPANSLYYMGSALVFRAIFAMIADKADGVGFGMGRLRLCESGSSASAGAQAQSSRPRARVGPARASRFARMRTKSCSAWRSTVRFLDHPDMCDCRERHRAFALIAFEGGNEGIEHACTVGAECVDHGRHSRREGDTLRDPTRRR